MLSTDCSGALKSRTSFSQTKMRLLSFISSQSSDSQDSKRSLTPLFSSAPLLVSVHCSHLPWSFCLAQELRFLRLLFLRSFPLGRSVFPVPFRLSFVLVCVSISLSHSLYCCYYHHCPFRWSNCNSGRGERLLRGTGKKAVCYTRDLSLCFILDRS